MNLALDISVPLIKKFEECRLRAYQDQVGVWTIGWGETLDIKQGNVWTQEKADTTLTRRVTQFTLAVLSICPALWAEPPARLAACVSLAYNIGVHGFRASSVQRRTARRDYTGAADSFLLWNKAGGVVNRGLVLRRKKERIIYLGG